MITEVLHRDGTRKLLLEFTPEAVRDDKTGEKLKGFTGWRGFGLGLNYVLAESDSLAAETATTAAAFWFGGTHLAYPPMALFRQTYHVDRQWFLVPTVAARSMYYGITATVCGDIVREGKFLRDELDTGPHCPAFDVAQTRSMDRRFLGVGHYLTTGIELSSGSGIVDDKPVTDAECHSVRPERRILVGWQQRVWHDWTCTVPRAKQLVGKWWEQGTKMSRYEAAAALAAVGFVPCARCKPMGSSAARAWSKSLRQSA